MSPIIVIDNRTAIKQGPDKGRYHIKIKLTFKGLQDGKKVWIYKRAKTNVYATEKEFKSMMGSRPSAELKEKRDILDGFLSKAKELCKIEGLTPDQYIDLMEGSGKFDNIIDLFNWYIDKMKKEDRPGNASAMESAKNSFIKFRGSESISFSEITVDWLNDYKRWMLSEDEKTQKVKQSITTVYIYSRALRVIFNTAVHPFRKISKDSIPFGKGKFKIPASKKTNRKVQFTLELDDLIKEKNKILSYTSTDEKLMKAVDFWKISYFGNGCNMADVARWKFKDYNNDIIKFRRKKTELTEEGNEEIPIYVSKELKKIIQKHCNKSVNPDEYIFPIISNNLSAKEQHTTVKQFTKTTNKYLERAAADMDLKIPLTTGTARYLMSTILRRKGVNLTAIRDLLGHGSVDTTEHYADGTDVGLMKTINSILLN